MTFKQRSILGLAMLVLVGAVLAVGNYSWGEAHAEVERSTPAAGDHLDQLPQQVEIFFSQEIDADGTLIEIFGPNGAQVDGGDTTLDLMDPDRKRVTISIATDAGPGTYSVRWTSLSSEDAEEASGSFDFTVGDSNATPGASPVASPVASPTGTPAA